MSASAAPVPRSGPMLRAMVGVGLACGLLIVSVYVGTLPIIEQNRQEALERAILQVLPGASRHATFVLDAAGGFLPASAGGAAGERVHAGYDGEGRLLGLAIEAEGMGYQDVIQLLYGYAIEPQAIVGLRVLGSRETPGLGDKIETDATFLKNFERLDVALAPGGEALAHPIAFVKPGQKEHPWQVDGITGATISTQAVAEILGRSAAAWMPRIAGRLDDFRSED